MLRGDPREKLPEGTTGRSREAIARLVGLSGRTVEKALYIVEHGDVILGLKRIIKKSICEVLGAYLMLYRSVSLIV